MASIGFIGVGHMGSRMATRLVDAGHVLTVCDRDAAALASFAARGVATTGRAAECASADAIFVIVATDDQLLSVARELRDGTSRGSSALLVVMSTVLPQSVRQVRDELAPLGVRVVDAPISGGLVGAADGTLSIMVGGDVADFDAVRPFLDVLGRSIVHCGSLGAGEVAKIVNNMVGVTNLYLAAEAYQLALRNGMDLATLARVMDAGSGRCFMTEDIATARAQYATWTASATPFESLAHIIRKDLSLAAKLAADAGLDLPVLDHAIAATSSIGDDVFARWREVANTP